MKSTAGPNCTAVAIAIGCLAAPVLAAPLDLYEWAATAPVMAVVEVRNDRGKYLDVEVAESLRGGLAVGARLPVDLKRANRDREEGRPALRLEPGPSYLVLLRQDGSRLSEGRPVFRLVRGIDGARELPAEGAPAILDAMRRFVGVQDRKDEIGAWKAFREMLEETNPVLLETSLDLFLKFRRGDVALLPVLRPLLDHPRPDLRARAARLIGQIVERKAEREIPDDVGLLAELYARARRDSATEVRVAATIALGGIAGGGPEEILREIARSDPEQSVRYEAEKVLYERNAGRKPESPSK